jgi:hypothetical protein
VYGKCIVVLEAPAVVTSTPFTEVVPDKPPSTIFPSLVSKKAMAKK